MIDSVAAKRESNAQTLELVQRATAGDDAALVMLVDRLTPVVQARVSRSLLRRGAGNRNTDLRESVKDLTQDIFLELFKNNGETLRRWDPLRGASLENFVGLLTERRVISQLRRSHRQSDIDISLQTSNHEEPAAPSSTTSPERWATSRDLLNCIIQGVRKTLSPLGWTMFEMLFVWDGSIDEISRELGMNQDAVRKWRSRLRVLARQWAAKCEKIGWEHG